MSRRFIVSFLWLALAAPTARAQVAFSRDLLPSRPALDRLGLERHWSAIVPMGDATERVTQVSLAENMLFIQTNHAFFHAFDAESGRHLWDTKIGPTSLFAQPASVNSSQVFVTNDKSLYCLDRATGREMWKQILANYPSSATAADEERVIVGLVDGKVSAFTARDHSRDEKPGLSAGTNLFNYSTRGKITSRPISTEKVVAVGSQDGRVYVGQWQPPLLLYRFLTGGPISASMGTLGTRTLLVPSGDNNLYAVDLFTAETKWVFPSGSPIEQEPLVAESEIFVINSGGEVRQIDSETGEPKWTVRPGLGKLLSIGATRLYVATDDFDLVVIDRSTGNFVATARDSYERAGLNLREYSISLTNRLDDRLYFATPSGMLLCIRETGKTAPTYLRDPKTQVPFGTIPDPDAAEADPGAAPVDMPPATPPTPTPAPAPGN